MTNKEKKFEKDAKKIIRFIERFRKKNGSPPSHEQIAEYLDVSTATINNRVKKLIKMRLVERPFGPRTKCLKVTKKGEEFL